MNSIEDILGMIMTEAAEGGDIGVCVDYERSLSYVGRERRVVERDAKRNKIEAIHYNLELIKNPDGTYTWIDE